MKKYVVSIIKKSGEIITINDRTAEDVKTLRFACNVIVVMEQA